VCWGTVRDARRAIRRGKRDNGGSMFLRHWPVRPVTARPVRGLAAAGLGVLLASGALGCSGGEADTSGLPTLGASPSAPAPSASPSPTLGYEPKDPDGIGAWVKVGKIHADTPEEKAAAHAWITFTKIFIRSGNERDVKFAEIEAVSGHAGKDAILSAIAKNRRNDHFVTGELRMGVSKVKISGNNAVITSCDVDGLHVVDNKGASAGSDEIVTKVRTGKLVKLNGHWLVNDWSSAEKASGHCNPEW
jgi:hypothetical protein